MNRPSLLLGLAAAALVPVSDAGAHESFLLWHGHRHAAHAGHDHHADHAGHDHGKKEVLHEEAEGRWTIGSGVRYTRYSLHDERAELWESGVGVAYRVTPWLEVGAEATYGWFSSQEGGTGGWMLPHFHVDVHIPVAEHLELVIGGGTGIPGGDEGLVGDHWEFVPHLALRYDTGKWFAEAGASYAFISGHDHDHSSHEEESHHEEHDHEEGHGEDGHEETHARHDSRQHRDEHSAGDFHEIVDPHGEQELQYHLSAGVRLLDERLTVEGRFSGVHVTRGYTPDRDYLRGGLRATWAMNDNWRIRAEASVPITEARRNHFQGSLSVQVGF